MARARDRGCTGARSAEAPAAASTHVSQDTRTADRIGRIRARPSKHKVDFEAMGDL